MKYLKPVAIVLGRVAATLVILLVAAHFGQWLWTHYRVEPWTRDGRVRADVVQVAPDVSGLITEVRVHDNASVKVGDVLFVVDRPRFELALAQAQATLESVKVQLAQARREDKRNSDLGDLVAEEVGEQSKSKVDGLVASLAQATTAVDVARLNLVRTEVKASVPGLVTNLDLRPGAYASAGRPVLALLDRDSVYVVGYFEETKLPRVRVGDPVEVRLMGETQILTGRVESIAGGIDDRERSASSDLLANVNPTFNWVRLAQRIPVRIRMDPLPAGTQLIMGQTATVEVKHDLRSALAPHNGESGQVAKGA